MKTILLIIVLIPIILHGQDVHFKWAKQFASQGYSVGSAIATDKYGNIHTVGQFRGTVDFDPGPGMYNLTGGGMYISKLDSAGNFIWVRQIHAMSGSESIALDGFGNIYLTGSFSGNVDFDPGLSIYSLSSNQDYSHMCFVAKLDTAGNFVWAKKMGRGGYEAYSGQSIKTDANGNVYTSGIFTDIADFDPGPGTFNLFGDWGMNIFISKLDSAGNFIWAKAPQLFSNSPIYADYALLSIDDAGNVYCTGSFGGEMDFDPGPGVFVLDSDNNPYGWDRRDIFVWKLTANGSFAWAKKMGGDINIDEEYNAGFDIIVDPSGNVYSIGEFQGTVDFDPGPGVHNLSSPVFRSNYISKLDNNGNFVWARQMRTPGRLSNDVVIRSISLYGFSNIYITGYFVATADLDPGPGIYNLTASGIDDMFISSFDTAGNFVWAKQMTGAGSMSFSNGNSITLEASGNIYTTGDFKETADFDPSGRTFNLGATGETDAFVHKMGPCANSLFSSITLSTCKAYTLNGQTYTASGEYTQIVKKAAGCDSIIITLNLIINRIAVVINVAACESYKWNNKTYKASGTYTDSLVSTNGCDSIVTLNLTISTQSISTITRSICTGQSYDGYNTSGTYIDTLIAVNGCDSIRTLQLTVLPIPVPDLGDDKNLCPGDSVILYPGSFNTYTWYNGSAQSHITVSQPGRYSVVVTDYCGSATDEIMIAEANCDIYFPSAFTPNNDGKNDWFKMLGGDNVKEFRLVVYNRWGQKVFESFDPAKGWNGLFNGLVQSSATFVWYCEFSRPGTADKTKMKGTVTLIK